MRTGTPGSSGGPGTTLSSTTSPVTSGPAAPMEAKKVDIPSRAATASGTPLVGDAGPGTGRWGRTAANSGSNAYGITGSSRGRGKGTGPGRGDGRNHPA